MQRWGNTFLLSSSSSKCIASTLSNFSVAPAVSFPDTEFRERRQNLIKRIREQHKESVEKNVVVLLKGATRSYMAPDVPCPFRQCSHFRYLSGVNVADCYLLMEAQPTGNIRQWLFMNRRNAYEELWEGPHPSPDSLIATSGAIDILPIKQLNGEIMKMIKGSFLCFDPSAQWSSDIHMSIAQAAGMTPLNHEVDHLRYIKSDLEIKSMEHTCEVGSQMMTSLIAKSKGILYENEMVGRLELEARRRGADMLAYPPVVASANRANTIHYLDANNVINYGDTVLVDAGCDIGGYVSDITRCFPISGQWSEPQRVLYDALNYVHTHLLAFANSEGKVRLSRLYTRMVELICVAMVQAGVLSDGLDKRELIRASEELCPHHVSHYLGMDVHDCASVSRDIDLPPGVVFTIEPGVYITTRNKLCRSEFHGIGYRIEDDIITTDQGIRVLTGGCERDADSIELTMRS